MMGETIGKVSKKAVLAMMGRIKHSILLQSNPIKDDPPIQHLGIMYRNFASLKFIIVMLQYGGSDEASRAFLGKF